MALFIRQDEKRTELQNRLAAELQERARTKDLEPKLPDGVDDSQYIKGTKKTTSLAWAWMLIVFATIVIIVWLSVLSMAK